MSEDFNPRSNDATFATILARLEAQDRAAAEARNETQQFRRDLLAAMQSHSSRISNLEADKNKMIGFAAASGAATGGAFHWFTKLFTS